MSDTGSTALFIGNRDCFQVRESDIEAAIIQAIQYGVDTFLSGGQGHFDRISALTTHKLKEQYPFIKSYLLIPYRTFKDYNAELYDEIIFPFEEHIESYYTYIGNIQKRNKKMVEMSSVAICYVHNTTGGAAKTLDYAIKRGLKIIDLTAAI